MIFFQILGEWFRRKRVINWKKKLYFEKFGCRAHKDKLSVIMSQDKITNEIYPIIEFSSSEMIKPKDTYSFIEVPSSVHALQKKF